MFYVSFDMFWGPLEVGGFLMMSLGVVVMMLQYGVTQLKLLNVCYKTAFNMRQTALTFIQCVSGTALLLLIFSVHHVLILFMTLKALWEFWTKNPLEHLHLVLPLVSVVKT